MADPATEGLAVTEYLKGNLTRKETMSLIEQIVKFRGKPLKSVRN